jgi:hypothetical protein
MAKRQQSCNDIAAEIDLKAIGKAIGASEEIPNRVQADDVYSTVQGPSSCTKTFEPGMTGFLEPRHHIRSLWTRLDWGSERQNGGCTLRCVQVSVHISEGSS